MTADAVSDVTPGSDAARIAAGEVEVELRRDGTFDLRCGEARFQGLGALESQGDRGDSYDFDPVMDGRGLSLSHVSAERRLHPSGIQELVVLRRFELPAGLTPDRAARAEERVPLEVEMRVRVAPTTPRVDLALRLDNAARDHRLRMLFPVDGPVRSFEAATTFDVTQRVPGPADDTGWVQRAPATFVHQGFVHAGGLTLVAPGLPEAEVVGGPAGEACVALTLLRCVGSLSRHDLTTRPGPAGPGTDTPEAQCPGPWHARLALLVGSEGSRAQEAQEAWLALRAYTCGDETLVPEGEPLLRVEPEGLLLSAFKPAEQDGAVVVRVLNPSDAAVAARITPGFPFGGAGCVRLDETPCDDPVSRQGATLELRVPPHALRTLQIALD